MPAVAAASEEPTRTATGRALAAPAVAAWQQTSPGSETRIGAVSFPTPRPRPRLVWALLAAAALGLAALGAYLALTTAA